MAPLFSICVPNYNYGRYLGATIESVLDQEETDFELIVADNASTDYSLAVVRKYRDPRIRVIEHPTNIGFAANVDRVSQAARGQYILVLSSDDLMRPGALVRYREVFRSQGALAAQTIVTSSFDFIDGAGRVLDAGVRPVGEIVYRRVSIAEVHDLGLDTAPAWTMVGAEALRGALLVNDSPAAFLATCFPRALYERVGGYHSGARIRPDSEFLFRMLALDTELVYVPARLFAYRRHGDNQSNKEEQAGALLFAADAYLRTLEFPDRALDAAGLSRDQLVQVFVDKSVLQRGLQALASGGRHKALRSLFYALSTYPEETLRQKKTYLLALLLALGSGGPRAADVLYRGYRAYKAARTQPPMFV